MEKQVVKNPTVKEMIDLLSTMPPNMPFRMVDADTDWTIETIHYQEFNNMLILWGEYVEMAGDYGNYKPELKCYECKKVVTESVNPNYPACFECNEAARLRCEFLAARLNKLMVEKGLA